MITMQRVVAPVRERGLKYQRDVVMPAQAKVAPVRERGLKLRRLGCNGTDD